MLNLTVYLLPQIDSYAGKPTLKPVKMNLLRFQFILFLLLGCFIPHKSIGQDIRFKHLTTNDGLSQNAILAMVQDSDGFMWFGTKDGLNKYDGYRFIVFQNEPNNPNSISSNYISELFTDSNGKLWVGTENGLYMQQWGGQDKIHPR